MVETGGHVQAGKSRTEAGAEYTDSGIHMKYDNYYDPGLSDNNKIKENNIAAFGKYTVAIANRFEISAGLRYEHVNYRYFLNGVRVDDRNRTYDDLFPSASLSGKIRQTRNVAFLLIVNVPSVLRFA